MRRAYVICREEAAGLRPFGAPRRTLSCLRVTLRQLHHVASSSGPWRATRARIEEGRVVGVTCIDDLTGRAIGREVPPLTPEEAAPCE